MIRRLIEALHVAKLESLSGEEIADILWLAVQRERGIIAPSPGLSDMPGDDLRRDIRSKKSTIGDTPLQWKDSSLVDAGKEPVTSSGGNSRNVFLPDSADSDDEDHVSGGLGGIRFPSPGVAALPNQLAIDRSLRPLSLRIPSPVEMVFDIEGTVRNIAEERTWIPLRRPATERWLELALVIDESANMVIWRQTADELQSLFERQGTFRTVTRWGMRADQTHEDNLGILSPAFYAGSRYSGGGLPSLRSPQELANPHNRRLIMIVSDCVALGWRTGQIANLLARWTDMGMVTLVQVLPENLWPRTGLVKGIQVMLQAAMPGVPNSDLQRQYRWHTGEEELPDGLLLPITTLEPERLSLWARSLVGRGQAWTPGILFLGERFESSQPIPMASDVPYSVTISEPPDPTDPKELVEHFFAEASDLARRLASYMAVLPLSLPIIRLVQETMMAEVEQVHLAEVFLSDLIVRQPGQSSDLHPDEILYDFRPGVREILLTTLLESEITEVLERTSYFIERHTGQPISFQSLLADPNQAGEIQIDKRSKPFATVTIEVLRFLGGVYRDVAEQLEISVGFPFGLSNADNQEIDAVRSAYPLLSKITRLPPGADGISPLQPALLPIELQALEDLVDHLPKSFTSEHIDQILRAYVVASDAHRFHMRRTGEPYILHPLAVAKILCELGLDPDTLTAGLLHDVVEDSGYSLEYLETRFSGEIAILVDGVTKLNRITELSNIRHSVADEKAESLRKMFLAMVEDIRVVLIKLADRLHNMRTLPELPDHKRRRIARETLEIFVPLADRLGIWQIKWELEDLSFRYLEPTTYKELSAAMQENHAQREEWVAEVHRMMKEAMDEAGLVAEISARLKHIYSTYRKMVRNGVTFDQIYDIHGFRVVVDNVAQCYAALGVVHSLWRPIPGEFDDYIANPKHNLYRSLHTAVVGPAGKPMEVQIRTKEMHHVAEYGIAAHWRYKEQMRPNEALDNKIAWIRQLMEWRQDVTEAQDFVSSMKTDGFQDHVYVFTARSDVIDLPTGATPIDFAYHVQTELGHRCRGAKVNGKLVPLDYQLRNGDLVEVVTAKRGGPSRDWINPNLGYVATQRARSDIRAWLQKHTREEDMIHGKQMLEKEMNRLSVTLPFELVAELCGYEDLDDFLTAISYGDVDSQQITQRVMDYEQSQHHPNQE